MKNKMLILLSITLSVFFISFSTLKSTELVHLTIENRISDSGEYVAELYASILSGNNWDIGPCTIVIEYNSVGLSPIDSNNLVSYNIHYDLASDAYYIMQSNYDNNQIAINIFNYDKVTTKSGKFKICDIRWNIKDGTKLDNLKFIASESVLSKEATFPEFTDLTAGCSTISCWNFTNPSPNTIEPTLAQPILSTPADASTNVSLTPTLDWNNISGATGYNIVLSTDPTFSSFVVNTTSATDSYTIPTATLAKTTKYYWKIQATNSTETSYWSSIYDFTTTGLSVPNLHLPLNTSSGIELLAELKWYEVATATNYDVEVSKTSSFTTTVLSTNTSDTTYTFTSNLDYNTKYYWRVRSKDGSNISAWSSTWDFTTEQFYVPYLISPANISTGISSLPTHLWRSVVHAQKYTLQISETISFTTKVLDVEITDTTYTLTSNLDYNKTYYWRANAIDGSNISAWSGIWSFTTETLNPPTLESPSDNETNVVISEILEWFTAANATTYTLEVSETNTFTTKVIDVTVSDTTYTPTTNFDYGTKYYWRVKSINGSSESSWSSVWEFTTEISITLVAPTNGATDVIRKSPLVDWDNVSSATKYNYQIAESNSFTTTLFDAEVTSSKVNPSYLNKNITYYWRIRAYVFGGYSDWSDIWSFTSEDFAGPTLSSPSNNSTDLDTFSLKFQWSLEFEAKQGYDLEISSKSDFSTIFFDTSNYDGYKLTLSKFAKGTKYYWHVRTNNNNEASSWSSTFNFKTVLHPVPGDWDFVDNTGKSSSIVVLDSGFIKLCSRDIAVGDYIGAFFDDSGVSKCAGYSKWIGSNLSIAVWGDDALTTEKDGFDDNEDYSFKIWDSNLGNEFDANVTIKSGNDYFLHNDIVTIRKINTCVTPLFDTLLIPLKKRWSMISSNVIATKDTIPDVFNDIISNMIIVKNGGGQIYYPLYGIEQIHNWDIEEGYLVYLTNIDTLKMIGSRVDPTTQSITVKQRWNMISFLRNTNLSIVTALSDIDTSDFIIVKDGNGKIYYPKYGINSIGDMLVGSGYLVYMRNALTFNYPSNPPKRNVNETVITGSPTMLIPDNNNSPRNCIVIISTDLPNKYEIGAYNDIGELIGSGLVQNGFAAVTIFADDGYTNIIDGAKNDEEIFFKLLNINNNQLIDINLKNINDQIKNKSVEKVIYNHDAIYSAKLNIDIPMVEGSKYNLTVSPNPVSSQTRISFDLEDKHNILLSLYDNSGKFIRDIFDGELKEGHYSYDLQTNSISSGVYHIVFKTNEDMIRTKIVIQK